MTDLLYKWNLHKAKVTEISRPESKRRIYKISSKDECYILKGIPDHVAQSTINSNVNAHLFLGNERNIAPNIYPTSDGIYYYHYDGYWFYLMEYIQGRKMCETAEDEFLLGQLAAKLHSYSEYKLNSPISQSTERFYGWFCDRSFKKDFDAVIDSLPDFSQYDQCLIHSDLGPHNAMLRSTGEAVLIDLDDTGLGSRYMDIGWAFIMQFVNYNRSSDEMSYRFDLAESFLKGYYSERTLDRSEYDMIWYGAVYMHIAYMQCYGPDAVESLWNILKFGMMQKELLWDRFVGKH